MDLTAAATLFAWLDREVWLITAQAKEERGGLIATFVSQVSIVPDLPRIMVGISRLHRTWALIEASQRFAIHLLSEENLDLVWQFGLESGAEVNKFEHLADLETTSSGCPLIPKTIGWVDCRVETSLDIGDRSIYVGEVVEGKVLNFAPPLTSKRLMELAPTTRLTQMQRRRHHESYRDADAIRAWRRARGGQD